MFQVDAASVLSHGLVDYAIGGTSNRATTSLTTSEAKSDRVLEDRVEELWRFSPCVHRIQDDTGIILLQDLIGLLGQRKPTFEARLSSGRPFGQSKGLEYAQSAVRTPPYQVKSLGRSARSRMNYSCAA